MKDNDKKELFDENGNSRGFYSIKNQLNDLTGKEWVYWSKSVINKQYPPDASHKIRSQHGGQKPPRLCADIIKIFTKAEESVLDPFAGAGGTLLGASLCGRKATGIEIDAGYIDIYKEACQLEKVPVQTMLIGDSNTMLPGLLQEGALFDFILTDVPYWNMDKVDRSKGKYKKVGEAQKLNKQSKLKEFTEIAYQDKAAWLDSLSSVFTQAVKLLKQNHYLAVFIGDMYNKGQYHFLSADVAQILYNLNLTMKANLVWYDVSKSLHVYGYQYQFIPSLIHQNILIFRKESKG